MSWELTTLVYDGPGGPWTDLTDVASGPLIRASLQGGVQTIEFDLADDYVDAYRWAIDHVGCKVFVFDNTVTPPVAEGKLFDPAISQDGNHITAYGPWLYAMYSQVYNDTSTWAVGGTISQQILDILTTECPEVNSDQRYIAGNAIVNAPWQPHDNAYPGDLIKQLCALGDGSNRERHFYLKSAPMTGITPNKPLAYYRPPSYFDMTYTCRRADMAPGGLDLMPSLRGLANDVRVMYRDAAGVEQQTASYTDTDSINRYGLRERWDYELGPASATTAGQYATALRDKFKDPQQSANFVLNSWLYDNWGGRWPLWRGIADFPFILTVTDLIPDSSVLGHSLDNKRTYMTLAVEYDYDRNTLTVTPDTWDDRADVLLARHAAFK